MADMKKMDHYIYKMLVEDNPPIRDIASIFQAETLNGMDRDDAVTSGFNATSTALQGIAGVALKWAENHTASEAACQIACYLEASPHVPTHTLSRTLCMDQNDDLYLAVNIQLRAFHKMYRTVIEPEIRKIALENHSVITLEFESTEADPLRGFRVINLVLTKTKDAVRQFKAALKVI